MMRATATNVLIFVRFTTPLFYAKVSIEFNHLRNIIKELCENKYVRNHFNKTNVFLNDLQK